MSATVRNALNGHEVFIRTWKPPQPTGWVVLLHGFGEHGGRYEPFAQALAQRGLAVICADLWGHGRSGGPRGDVERFDEYLRDLEAVLSRHLAPDGEVPAYAVFGHSFGGLLAAHWARRRPAGLRAVILQSPLFQAGFPLPRWNVWLVDRGARWCPRLTLPLNLDPAWLSHDPHVVRRYQQDPLVHGRITLRCAAALQAAMRQAMEEAAALTIPTLLLYGEEDRVVSIAACLSWSERLTCEKRVVGFPGCFHELHHEAAQPAALEDVVHWIQTHA